MEKFCVNYAFSSVIRRENFECYRKENKNFLLNLTIGDEIIKASSCERMSKSLSLSNHEIVTVRCHVPQRLRTPGCIYCVEISGGQSVFPFSNKTNK